MKNEVQSEENDAPSGKVRRIVVSDDLPVIPHEVRGRRLENPPPETLHEQAQSATRKTGSQLLQRPRVLALAGVAVVLVATIAVLAVNRFRTRSVPEQPIREKVAETNVAREERKATDEPDDLRQIEEQAKQVIRVISRDNRSYSFGERSLKEIQSRSVALSHSPQLLDALRQLQAKGELVAARSAKEGLQPGLVMLLGLALTHGGESGDAAKAAVDAVPLLASLNKTFGSRDGDSCLVLLAAFSEGAGTRRSHPLLRRMNRVVANPLTERNVWYLNEQRVLSANAYALVIDTIAFGVITRNPRQFGFDSDPLNF
jgi:hypothetical protein